MRRSLILTTALSLFGGIIIYGKTYYNKYKRSVAINSNSNTSIQIKSKDDELLNELYLHCNHKLDNLSLELGSKINKLKFEKLQNND